jgi:hypothetical protein
VIVALRRGPTARIAGLLIVSVALVVGVWARRSDLYLGAKTAPLFWVEYRDTFPPRWWWPIAPLLVAMIGALVVLRLGERVGQRLFPILAFGIALVARAGLATTHFGRAEWWWPFDRPGGRASEYPSAFGVVNGHPLAFLDHFAELVPHLPIHPSGHPAGATLLSLVLYRAGGGVEGYAEIVMALSAATAWPAYWAGRRLVGDQAARFGVLVWAFAPVTLIYGATSFDGLFGFVALLVVAAFASERLWLGAVGSAVLFFLSYALALVPLYAALTARPRRRAVTIAAVSAAAGLVSVVALYLLFGYDTLGAVRATQDAYQRGIGGRRPFWYWCFGGMAAFLICLGPVLAERFLRGIERGTPGARALAICCLAAAASGVMEAEVERIWQFAVPLAAIAAAPVLTRRRVELAIVLGVLMAYAIELRWDTTF